MSRLRHEPGTVATDVEMLTKQIQRRAGHLTPPRNRRTGDQRPSRRACLGRANTSPPSEISRRLRKADCLLKAAGAAAPQKVPGEEQLIFFLLQANAI